MTKENQILLYETDSGETLLEVLYQDESLWLTQRAMAALFQKDVSSINRHISNIYKERELEKDPTIAFYAIVQNEGGRRVSREVAHYNLDMIISVGYRVNSYRGTQFRIWATKQLRELMLDRYALINACNCPPSPGPLPPLGGKGGRPVEMHRLSPSLFMGEGSGVGVFRQRLAARHASPGQARIRSLSRARHAGRTAQR